VDVVAHLVATGPAPGRLGRLLLRTRVPADDLSLASATPVWRGAAWHERETHEMFGVGFPGFVDASGAGLRPLLLPDGFEGTPLRKSFVLAARAAKAWPGAKEPGESGEGHASPSRRKVLPPGVPDASWGPRRPAPPAAPGEAPPAGDPSDATTGEDA
jgi:NADH-quinone oxidoreductase subunit C